MPVCNAVAVVSRRGGVHSKVTARSTLPPGELRPDEACWRHRADSVETALRMWLSIVRSTTACVRALDNRQ